MRANIYLFLKDHCYSEGCGRVIIIIIIMKTQWIVFKNHNCWMRLDLRLAQRTDVEN